MRASRWIVGSGSFDSAASADSPITPPFSASTSRMVKARSMDCTPPARTLLALVRRPGNDGPVDSSVTAIVCQPFLTFVESVCFRMPGITPSEGRHSPYDPKLNFRNVDTRTHRAECKFRQTALATANREPPHAGAGRNL